MESDCCGRVLVLGDEQSRRLLVDRLHRQGVDARLWTPGADEPLPEAGIWVLSGAGADGTPGGPLALLPEGTLVLADVDPPRTVVRRERWTNYLALAPVRVRLRTMCLEAVTRDLLVHGLALLNDQTVVLGGAGEMVLPLARTLRSFRCRPVVATDNVFDREMARLQGFATQLPGDVGTQGVAAALVDHQNAPLGLRCRQAGVPLVLQAWPTWGGHDLLQADEGYAVGHRRFYEHLFPSAWSDALFPLVLEALGQPFSASRMAAVGR